MATVPALPGAIVVGKIRASVLELIRLVAAFLLAPPIVQARCTGSTQSLTTTVAQVISFDTEDIDSHGMHSTSVNPSRFTAVYSGWYLVSGSVLFDANPTGRRRIYLQVNGVAIPASGVYFGAAINAIIVLPRHPMLVYLAVGDYLEMTAWQDSGSNVVINQVSASSDANTIITIRRVSS